MSAESTIYDILIADAALSALIGNRVYPDAMPEDAAYPVVIITRTGTEPVVTIDGNRAAQFVDVQIQCWGKTRESADAVADAAENALIVAKEIPRDREAAFDPETALRGSVFNVTVFIGAE